MKSKQKRLCIQCEYNNKVYCNKLLTDNMDIKIEKCHHNSVYRRWLEENISKVEASLNLLNENDTRIRLENRLTVLQMCLRKYNEV